MNIVKILCLSLILTLSYLLFGSSASAFASSGVPQPVQDLIIGDCNAAYSPPASPPPGLMIGFAYPNPAQVSGLSGNVNLFATAYICPQSQSQHSTAGNINITISELRLFRGSGTLSLSGTAPNSISVGNLHSAGVFAGPGGPHVATFSNLSPHWNCWTFTLTMTADGWNQVRTGHNSLCIYRTPPIWVQGIVYDAVTGRVIRGVTVETCRGHRVTTGGDGEVRFEVPGVGSGYCLHVVGVPGNYDINTTRVRPWNSRYLNCRPSEPPTAVTCSHTSYENQIAGQHQTFNNPHDRNTDIGFDFVIQPKRPPTGNVQANCDGRGRVFGSNLRDPDSPGTPLRVSFIIAGLEAGSATTNIDDDGGLFSIDVSAWADWGTRSFLVIVRGVDAVGREDDSNFLNIVSNGPCAPPTCNPGVTTIPSDPEAGQDFRFTRQFDYRPGSFGRSISRQQGHVMRMWSTGTLPIYNNTDQLYETYDSGGRATSTAAIRALSPGVIHTSYTLTGNGINLNCPGQITIWSRPYLRVYGGDVVAGAGFMDASGQCKNNPAARLYAYNTGPDGHFTGAGSQLANFALGAINQFSSAMARGGVPLSPYPPKGLTFGNRGSGLPASPFGGGLGGNYINCVPDYWSQRPGTATIGPTFNPTEHPSGKYLSSSPSVTVNNPALGSLPHGRRITLFVPGDVFIQHNINYNATAAYSNRSAIPSFTIVATGNIYIDNEVRELSGTFIAQNGYIYTCTFGIGVMPTAAQLNRAGPDGCQNKLTVFGALVSNSVKFQRSLGSLRDSAANEVRDDLSIAEVIQYSPEVWLGHIPNPDIGTGIRRFDSIISLPPVL